MPAQACLQPEKGSSAMVEEVTHNLVESPTRIEAKSNEDLFLHRQTMTPLGSALEWIYTLNIYPLTVSSPVVAMDNTCHVTASLPIIEGEGQSQVEPEGLVPTGPPERGSKHPKKDDAYKQTKARLEIRLLKAKLGQAGLSTADEAYDDDDEEEGELIRRTTHNKN
ncbi:unnamed protein product [Pleuronectes platessa]|uniref:Uncharacterized protein n=1 Tax=Pleuronectes platessa TaxID=8262 RepID=A0A9N7UY06_PLEPL|nr:unnamed protein product [Pleuronectes platessa]